MITPEIFLALGLTISVMVGTMVDDIINDWKERK